MNFNDFFKNSYNCSNRFLKNMVIQKNYINANNIISKNFNNIKIDWTENYFYKPMISDNNSIDSYDQYIAKKYNLPIEILRKILYPVHEQQMYALELHKFHEEIHKNYN